MSIYYGLKKPKNKPNAKEATLKEALKARQLRLWGKYKIPNEELEILMKDNTTLNQLQKSKKKLIVEIFKIKGAIKKLKDRLTDKNVRNNKDKINEINNEISKLKLKINKPEKEFEEIEQKIKNHNKK